MRYHIIQIKKIGEAYVVEFLSAVNGDSLAEVILSSHEAMILYLNEVYKNAAEKGEEQ